MLSLFTTVADDAAIFWTRTGRRKAPGLRHGAAATQVRSSPLARRLPSPRPELGKPEAEGRMTTLFSAQGDCEHGMRSARGWSTQGVESDVSGINSKCVE